MQMYIEMRVQTVLKKLGLYIRGFFRPGAGEGEPILGGGGGQGQIRGMKRSGAGDTTLKEAVQQSSMHNDNRLDNWHIPSSHRNSALSLVCRHQNPVNRRRRADRRPARPYPGDPVSRRTRIASEGSRFVAIRQYSPLLTDDYGIRKEEYKISNHPHWMPQPPQL